MMLLSGIDLTAHSDAIIAKSDENSAQIRWTPGRKTYVFNSRLDPKCSRDAFSIWCLNMTIQLIMLMDLYDRYSSLDELEPDFSESDYEIGLIVQEREQNAIVTLNDKWGIYLRQIDFSKEIREHFQGSLYSFADEVINHE